MQGPIDRRDSGTGGVIAFGHRWSHCSRAYMLRWDPDTNGPCLATQAQMVLLHLGTDGPLHSGTDGPLHLGTDGPFTFFFSLRHRWSCCIWAQMVPCIRAQMVPLQFFFYLFFFLLSGTDGPVAFGHKWSCMRAADIQLY